MFEEDYEASQMAGRLEEFMNPLQEKARTRRERLYALIRLRNETLCPCTRCRAKVLKRLQKLGETRNQVRKEVTR